MPRRRDIASFTEALDAWPSLAVVSDDLACPYDTVRAWHRRNSIPSIWWDRLCESASVHRVPVSFGLLRRIALARHEAKIAQHAPAETQGTEAVSQAAAPGINAQNRRT